MFISLNKILILTTNYFTLITMKLETKSVVTMIVPYYSYWIR